MEFYNQSKQLKKYINEEKKKKDNFAELIAISSGKGGVGKSNFILNLAIALSIRGKKVLLIDADMNLSNIDVLLGLYPEFTLSNFLDELVSIEKVLIDGPKGIKILPAASGDINVMNNSRKLQKSLIKVYGDLRKDFDYILIDTGAGISDTTVDFIVSADRVILVTTPEPTSITDVYAMIKILFYRIKDPDISLTINMTQSLEEGQNIFNKIELIVKHFLNKSIKYLGHIQSDPHLRSAVKDQVPILIKNPRAISSVNIHKIAMKILKEGS
jgi:flagellar biosynthesis protein FlhG